VVDEAVVVRLGNGLHHGRVCVVLPTEQFAVVTTEFRRSVRMISKCTTGFAMSNSDLLASQLRRTGAARRSASRLIGSRQSP
jgi:hypothetical protein